MALTLDATVSGASANAYITVAEADAYQDGNFYSTDWFAATTLVKEQSIVSATRGLDVLMKWYGVIATTAQKLSWPRLEVLDKDGRSLSSATIPDFLQDATAEFAFALLKTDRFVDDVAGIGQLKIDVIDLDFASAKSSPQTLPDIVQQMVSPFGTILEGNQVRVDR